MRAQPRGDGPILFVDVDGVLEPVRLRHRAAAGAVPLDRRHRALHTAGIGPAARTTGRSLRARMGDRLGGEGQRVPARDSRAPVRRAAVSDLRRAGDLRIVALEARRDRRVRRRPPGRVDRRSHRGCLPPLGASPRGADAPGRDQAGDRHHRAARRAAARLGGRGRRRRIAATPAQRPSQRRRRAAATAGVAEPGARSGSPPIARTGSTPRTEPVRNSSSAATRSSTVSRCSCSSKPAATAASMAAARATPGSSRRRPAAWRSRRRAPRRRWRASPRAPCRRCPRRADAAGSPRSAAASRSRSTHLCAPMPPGTVSTGQHHGAFPLGEDQGRVDVGGH